MDNVQSMLNVSHLNAAYGSIQVLWDVGLSVPEGGIVSIIGANGAGKSTLVRALMGQIPIKSGKIEFNGTDITKLTTPERVKERLILIPDERGLFPAMTVLENLHMSGYTVKEKARIQAAIDWGYELFPILKKRESQSAGSLSGGEQQMLAMVKGLVSQPKLLILDEPSSGLAPIIIDRMFEVLEQFRLKGITILLVEQNVRRSLNISDYCYVMENGRIAMEGESAALKDDDGIRELYLGM